MSRCAAAAKGRATDVEDQILKLCAESPHVSVTERQMMSRNSLSTSSERTLHGC